MVSDGCTEDGWERESLLHSPGAEARPSDISSKAEKFTSSTITNTITATDTTAATTTLTATTAISQLYFILLDTISRLQNIANFL
ncbi:unnamed protein product [Thelazia callipaeda]|uniref:Uncharacterized protein n=1 Tax=Thelazia callipaeda TaxID=103827 RepID=A0A0N5DA58_THECL|nr:unnamed protein product [Thelazia callipaeda]